MIEMIRGRLKNAKRSLNVRFLSALSSFSQEVVEDTLESSRDRTAMERRVIENEVKERGGTSKKNTRPAE